MHLSTRLLPLLLATGLFAGCVTETVEEPQTVYGHVEMPKKLKANNPRKAAPPTTSTEFLQPVPTSSPAL